MTLRRLIDELTHLQALYGDNRVLVSTPNNEMRSILKVDWDQFGVAVSVVLELGELYVGE